MRQLWNSFKIAFSMYSKIPMPRADWEKENMRYMLCFFPLIGVFVGGGVFLWALLAGQLEMGTWLRTAGYVLIPIGITGGIHLDGLLDTADALSSYQSRERKLEILKDSHAGAFAVIAACCYFTAYAGIWSELQAEEILVLSGGFVLSRALSGLAVVLFPNTKKSGTAAMFSDAAQRKRTAAVLILLGIGSAAFMCVQNFTYGLAALLGAGLLYLYYYRMSKKQFGGITGDLAGFFLQLCELVTAAAVLAAGYFL